MASSLKKMGFFLAAAISLAGDVSLTYLAQITLPASEIQKTKKNYLLSFKYIGGISFQFLQYLFFVSQVFG